MSQIPRARQRCWAPKVKTGCKTCRVRRVKCDESRPFCKRCTLAGRECTGPGYANQSWPSQSIQPLIRQPQYSTTPSSVQASLEERRLFYHSQTATVENVAGAFDKEFWSRDVLKATQASPAIWHAGLALTSMYKWHSTLAKEEAFVREHCYKLALEQYNTAIKHLLVLVNQVDLSRADKEVILLAIVLFAGLCSLQGNTEEAIMHTYNGLKLVHQWGFWEEAGTSASARDSNTLPVTSLVTLLSRFDSQTGMIASRSAPMCSGYNSPHKLSAKGFACATEAYIEFELLLYGLIQLPRADELTPNSALPFPRPDTIVAFHEAFATWKAKFLDYKNRHQQLQPADEESMMILQLRLISVEYKYLLDLAQKLLEIGGTARRDAALRKEFITRANRNQRTIYGEENHGAYIHVHMGFEITVRSIEEYRRNGCPM